MQNHSIRLWERSGFFQTADILDRRALTEVILEGLKIAFKGVKDAEKEVAVPVKQYKEDLRSFN